MRGEILHYDVEQGIGFVSADDGNRYMFSRNDLQQSQRVGKGTRIDFRPDGQNAREVFVIDPRGPSVPSVGGGETMAAAASFGRDARPSAPALGVWGYFLHCCTAGYADFRSRARRKEYWSFVLFYVVAMIAASLLGVAVDAAIGNLDDGAPIATSVLTVIAVLFFLVPMLAVTVRRFHDVGLSGWLYLLFFVLSFVYIGGIIIFVLTLLPSQKHDNKWGPVPAGVLL